MIILYIIFYFVLGYFGILGLFILFRNAQIWFNFKFRNRICYPLIKAHTGFFYITVIDEVNWYWCKIDKETKPKYYWKHFFEYPPIFIDYVNKTASELKD